MVSSRQNVLAILYILLALVKSRVPSGVVQDAGLLSCLFNTGSYIRIPRGLGLTWVSIAVLDEDPHLV